MPRNSNSNEVVYNNITDMIAERGIYLSDLEKKAGLGNGSISKWRKNYPNVSALEKVANALNVPLPILFM